MSDPSFSTTFLVKQTPAEVFAAVTDVRGWWSQQIDGRTDQLGAEFHYDNGDLHQATMRIIELVPDRLVVWRCLDNHFSFIEDKTEWIGTTLHFQILKEAGQTCLCFTHVGLVPDYECFDVCASAWGGYVGSSLRSLITTGAGNPNNAVRDAEALSHRGRPTRGRDMNTSLRTTFTVRQTPQQAFDASGDVRSGRSGQIEGTTVGLDPLSQVQAATACRAARLTRLSSRRRPGSGTPRRPSSRDHPRR